MFKKTSTFDYEINSEFEIYSFKNRHTFEIEN